MDVLLVGAQTEGVHSMQRIMRNSPQRKKQPPIPNIAVWTEVEHRTVQSLAPRTCRLEAGDKNGGFLISEAKDVGDLAKFAEGLALAAAKQGQPPPRFGPPGGADPGAPNANQAKVFIALWGYVLQRLDGDGGIGPGPIITEGGQWVRKCPNVGPCVRPDSPIPEDVNDCADEQRDMDLRLAELAALANSLKMLEKLLMMTQQAKNLIDENTDSIYWGLTAIAVVLSPATIPVTVAFMVSSVKLTTAAVNAIKDLLTEDGWILSTLIAVTKSDIEKTKKAMKNAQALLDMARAALDACKKAKAEATGNNTAAFQKHINKDLPAYYACLDLQRKCIWVWVPD